MLDFCHSVQLTVVDGFLTAGTVHGNVTARVGVPGSTACVGDSWAGLNIRSFCASGVGSGKWGGMLP